MHMENNKNIKDKKSKRISSRYLYKGDFSITLKLKTAGQQNKTLSKRLFHNLEAFIFNSYNWENIDICALWITLIKLCEKDNHIEKMGKSHK